MTRETLRAACARSATQETIGLPAISDNALPGNRLDSKRAGMIATAFELVELVEFEPVSFTGQQINLRT